MILGTNLTVCDSPPIVTFGDYELLRRVSIGGMAEIFEARRLAQPDAETVAIKRLLPGAQEDAALVGMFASEAKLVAQLSHRHIAAVRELGRVDGNDFIAYEFIAGRDLVAVRRRLVELERRMPPEAVASVGLQAAQGLDYAHRFVSAAGRPLRIVHRDVSPQNLMVGRTGCLKLVDFGIAKYAGSGLETEAGVVKGKHAYMSPEQVRREPLDGRSDIFSLGIILYELVSSTRLFKGMTLIDTLERVERAEVPPLGGLVPGLDERLERVIMSCLAKDRELRPKDAQLVEIALADFLRDQRVSSPEAVLAELLTELFGEELDQPGGATLSAYRQSLHSAELDGVETTDVRGDTNATIVFTR